MAVFYILAISALIAVVVFVVYTASHPAGIQGPDDPRAAAWNERALYLERQAEADAVAREVVLEAAAQRALRARQGYRP